MSETRRTISKWDSHPRDGSPFHILNTIRFNPIADRYEAIVRDDNGSVSWHPARVTGELQPSVWLRQAPLPYEIPTSFAWTMSYEVRPKRFLDRLLWRLFGAPCQPHLAVFHAARAAVGNAE